ncbi:MAG TPA: ribosome recycling factor [Dehalococcoidia bacterium]|nr:ribosome recycling factor [Dehalococcoidia bacterium]
MVQEQISSADARMNGAVDALRHELATIRTGRASTGLVEHLKVSYYGAPTPLNQLATISTPDPKMIMIQPFDKAALGEIEKAIQKSDIGLNPSNDGNVIRLAIPPLTEERRKDLAKQVKARTEEARVAIRNVRRDVHDHLRKIEHDHEISQDELHRSEGELQKVTDRHVAEVDRLGEEKEQEVLTI